MVTLNLSLREYYLVVDHDVYGAVSCIGRQVRQVECLVHDALTCKSSITMKQDGHHLENQSSGYKHIWENRHICSHLIKSKSLYPLALSVSTVELLSFGLSLHHWVHRFQVGRVRHE